MGAATNADQRFHGYRFPAVIIGEVIWLRFRFSLSLRDIPALMAARGIDVSHETVREWCEKFGAVYAHQLRRRRPRPGDKWHLDELVVSIKGARRYLWRAVDRGCCVVRGRGRRRRPTCRVDQMARASSVNATGTRSRTVASVASS